MKGPRLIASEPNQNQWIQQLMRRQLHGLISNGKKKFNPLHNCIDLSNQSHNAKLALSSSADGKFATIDLSSASDRFSLHTLERMFRRNKTFLERFNACRTSSIRNGIDAQFDTIVLKKAFSQGNALTFPVQSIGYAMICFAAVLIHRGLIPTSKNILSVSSMVRIYGDDIIVPVECSEILAILLEFLQFKINDKKSFFSGEFRESCGTDAYKGVDVTPTYVKMLKQVPKHEEIDSAVEASNNLHRNGWWHLAEWQSTTFKRYLRSLPIVDSRADTFGLVSFTGSSVSHLKVRYCSMLHRNEYQVLSLIDNSKKLEHPKGSYSFYQWVVEDPAPDLNWQAGITSKTSAVMRRGWSPLYDNIDLDVA
jgi:hypothetical protein